MMKLITLAMQVEKEGHFGIEALPAPAQAKPAGKELITKR
jgi:hypothetical protein